MPESHYWTPLESNITFTSARGRFIPIRGRSEVLGYRSDEGGVVMLRVMLLTPALALLLVFTQFTRSEQQHQQEDFPIPTRSTPDYFTTLNLTLTHLDIPAYTLDSYLSTLDTPGRLRYTDSIMKKSYRRLAREYHPDKVRNHRNKSGERCPCEVFAKATNREVCRRFSVSTSFYGSFSYSLRSSPGLLDRLRSKVSRFVFSALRLPPPLAGDDPFISISSAYTTLTDALEPYSTHLKTYILSVYPPPSSYGLTVGDVMTEHDVLTSDTHIAAIRDCKLVLARRCWESSYYYGRVEVDPEIVWESEGEGRGRCEARIKNVRKTSKVRLEVSKAGGGEIVWSVSRSMPPEDYETVMKLDGDVLKVIAVKGVVCRRLNMACWLMSRDRLLWVAGGRGKVLVGKAKRLLGVESDVSERDDGRGLEERAADLAKRLMEKADRMWDVLDAALERLWEVVTE